MKRTLIWTALLLVCVSLPLDAQSTTGAVRGTVSDPNGAPVAGASVTIINAETGLTRTMETSSSGGYNFSSLPVGTYLINVEEEGFSSVLVQNIVLNVADDREIDVGLELGAVTDEVTVTESSVVVETIGGEVAGLITGEQVRELPLNGRNFLQLTLLMPGVSAPDGFNTKNKGLLTGSDLSVSGGMTTGNMWTVDGANNNDVGSNRTILVYPSLEAVEEFKIHRNSYGAEFGGAGGAQINLVTRGGTNQLQGSVFYFQRRDSYNSKNAILKDARQPKAPLERDDYGYTVGGPIKKDRFHFFLSQEWNEEIRGVPRSGQVPTALERQGDFSQTPPDCPGIPVDPTTGQPFPNNVIPADRIGASGQAFLALYPDANVSLEGDCTNWVTSISTPIDWDQINARLDYTINESHRALVRFTEDDWLYPGPTAGDANGTWGDDPFPSVDSNWQQPSDSLVAQLNSVIGNSAINSVTFSTSGNAINIGSGGGTNAQLAEDLRTLVPSFFGRDGKLNNGVHPVFWGGGGLATVWTQGPWNNEQDIKLFKDDYEQVFGDHAIKAGVLFSQANKAEPLQGASDEQGRLWGSFPGNATGYAGNPWGGNSGNGVADFLLDGMWFGFSEISGSVPGNVEWEDLELYVADSWKASANVTFDYGIRYSRFDHPYNANGNEYLSFNPDRFDPDLGNSPCNGLMQVPGTDPCGDAGFAGATTGPNKALINDDDDNIAPRLGLAWDLKGDGDTVMRFGFGQFFQRDRVSPFLGLPGNPPLLETAFGIRTLDGQFAPDGSNFGRPSAGWDINRETPYMLQFNVSYEQRLEANQSIEVAYVGNRGKHLLQSQNVNFVPQGDNNGNGINDRLEYVQCDQDAGCRAQFTRFGVFGDGAITYWTTSGASEYDSIQTQYIARFGRGSQFQASYTYSDFKSRGDVAGSSGGLNATETMTDPQNPELDYGPAETHRDHVFNASLIHNLPSFEGEGGFKEWVLGNWAVGGIINYSSGVPITIFTGGFSGLAVAGGGTGYNDAQRPLRVPGVSCSGSGSRQIINPAAYTLDGYRLGDPTQQVRRGDCEGPDFFQVDLSLYKNIPIGDRVNAQLRIEIFNIFDEENWLGVDTQWDGDVTYDADLTTVVSSTPQPNFGRAFGARDAREMQLGLKLTF